MKIFCFISLLFLFPFSLFSQNPILSFADYTNSDFSLKNGIIKKISDQYLEIDVCTGKNTVSFEVPKNIHEKLSTYRSIVFNVANSGSSKCRINIWMVERSWISSSVVLLPGENKPLQIDLSRRKTSDIDDYFPKMNGLPGGTIFRGPALNAISKIKMEVFTEGTSTVKLSNPTGYYQHVSPPELAGAPDFFPFIDKFGQYLHDDWPGKTHSEKEMNLNHESELKELKFLDAPAEFNQYGGWKTGPAREGTGHFWVEKINGKWWLIDPEGKLFWSHGPTCVRFSNAMTQINGREFFYKDLPAENSTYDFCYAESNGVKTFNYTAANLYRKFGTNWEDKAIELVYKRFRSWGMNTYANWSDPSIYLNKKFKIPYTANFSSGGPRLDGKNKKFPDPFDPEFLIALNENAKAVIERIGDDPYCIGYFVDNELSVWDLAEAAFAQEESGYAKKKFVEMLKSKYTDIGKLNQQWTTSYKNWKMLSLDNKLPDEASADAREFEKLIIDKYYSECAKAVKKYAPQKLYMGSRLHCHYYPDDKREEFIIEIAAKHCDVISFNRYRFVAEDLLLPKGIDKPVIIGEFHFGALDRGYFHTGLRGVANQQQRAEAYMDYLEGALRNNYLVGAHWFQYGGQAFTGRFDGENYQIGIVDICDNPYPEFIKAIRNIGYKMYPYRISN